MTTHALNMLAEEELVALFRQITDEQYAADQADRSRLYNKLYRDMVDVAAELKRRPGDRRILLAQLFGDKNPQVRLMSAAAVLSVAPEKARETLLTLRGSGEYPQSANAGMWVDSFDKGNWPGLPPD